MNFSEIFFTLFGDTGMEIKKSQFMQFHLIYFVHLGRLLEITPAKTIGKQCCR